MRRLIVIMGVSGCGKSTVGQALSTAQNWPFIEGDDHHPASNVSKMTAGAPLTDHDRAAWIDALVTTVDSAPDDTIVLACSALTPFVQNGLRNVSDREVVFVLLEHQYEAIHARMAQRDHYMPPALLQSQFDALNTPQDALTFDASLPLNHLVDAISDALAI